uniref:PPIase cyclophilin-type domain-containing protein n=1 Tax=Kalanchoe fedtschenkoi TaxID=63787 RepID=A0A7N0TT06_KALFE
MPHPNPTGVECGCSFTISYPHRSCSAHYCLPTGILKMYSLAMLQTSKLLWPPVQPLCSQLPSLQPPHLRSALGQHKMKLCPLDLDHLGKHSRRALAISNSPLLLFLASQALDPFNILAAKAGDIEKEEAPASVTEQQGNETTSCSDTVPTKRAFIEISVDGQPQGRVVIGLYGNSVPGGAARFSSLVSGSAGVSYRRKEFTKIMPNYIQHGGVRSYGVDAEMAKKTGSDLGSERLAEEWERQNVTCQGTKMVAGSVGIVVRDPLKPPPKIKLVARKGKLEMDEEEVGRDPNGTEFVVAWKDSPELDASVLVVGRVLEGLNVVEKIGQVKKVQENTSSPYFRVAKLIGDKRAVVAERGFNRPYSKVVVTNCSLLD